ncbi:B3 domain-containing protein At5g42700-like [Rutidosis leptorrhynchoides]|uniref:B3 domain-containing protein At5g42700-like n=1 Tax=Rutidosis leptorrhynchoides TaxID=125765 RepID=UPI003A9A4263
MVASKSCSYEEFRRKRVEENKKRMEALNLPLLSLALRNSSPKTSLMKKVKPRNATVQKQVVEVRRSGRIANNPSPDYKEIVKIEPRTRSGRSTRDLSNRLYASDEARADAMERAEKLESELEPAGFPTLVKSMLQSHVSGGFWLGLSVNFCRTSLPKHDGYVTLVDEDGDESEANYLARKTGLSGGWKAFAVAHDLADGDAVVFQVIGPTRLKVFIYILLFLKSHDFANCHTSLVRKL